MCGFGFEGPEELALLVEGLYFLSPGFAQEVHMSKGIAIRGLYLISSDKLDQFRVVVSFEDNGVIVILDHLGVGLHYYQLCDRYTKWIFIYK